MTDLPTRRTTGDLELVATFPGPMPTRVSVSHTGRVFVNFPPEINRADLDGMAFITDSSMGLGPNAIIVVDLATGRSWRKLNDHASTKGDKSYLPLLEGHPLVMRSEDGSTEPVGFGSDGIAISADGSRLYYCPFLGRHLYSVSTDALADPDLPDDDVAATVVDEGDKGGGSDGLESDAEGRVYLTSYEHAAVLRREPDGTIEPVVVDPRLVFPDTLSLATDAYLYVTATSCSASRCSGAGRTGGSRRTRSSGCASTRTLCSSGDRHRDDKQQQPRTTTLEETTTVKAIVWHGVGDIRLDDVPDPTIQDDHDAIVEITTSAICGTDLHFVRGTMSGMTEGTVLGHEAVGVVREVGKGVRNLRPGDRVVVPSTIGCGTCSYCRSGYYSQCDIANPNGKTAGTAFFGGPQAAGGFDGFQAQYARVPFAHVGPVRLPESVTDEQAIMLSDIWPTGWFGAVLAEVSDGDTVAVFGAGPVGQFAVLSAFRQGAGRVLVVDGQPSRLDAARRLGAEPIDYNVENPVEVLQQLTGGAGPDRVIDAVGVDAQRPKTGPAAEAGAQQADSFAAEVASNAPETGQQGETWKPGDAPSQAAQWAVQAIAKAGTIGIIGVYPPTMQSWPVGMAMNKNLDVRMGNTPHRRYIPELLDLVASGVVDPSRVLTQEEPLGMDALEAYEAFDRREQGWVKTVLNPT